MARRLETAACAGPCNRVDRLRCITRSLPVQLVLRSFRPWRPLVLWMSPVFPLSHRGLETLAEMAAHLRGNLFCQASRTITGRVQIIGPNFGLLAYSRVALSASPPGSASLCTSLRPRKPESRKCRGAPVCMAAVQLLQIRRYSCRIRGALTRRSCWGE